MDLQNSFTAAKSSKFPTKSVLGYPPHLKYVAALPWYFARCSIILPTMALPWFGHLRNGDIGSLPDFCL